MACHIESLNTDGDAFTTSHLFLLRNKINELVVELNNMKSVLQVEIEEKATLENAVVALQQGFAIAAKEPQKEEPVHNIGWAVQKLKQGKHVMRAGWNGKDQWLALRSPREESSIERHTVYPPMTLPYVFIKTAQDSFVPWLCSQTDLLSEDWEEAK